MLKLNIIPMSQLRTAAPWRKTVFWSCETSQLLVEQAALLAQVYNRF